MTIATSAVLTVTHEKSYPYSAVIRLRGEAVAIIPPYATESGKNSFDEVCAIPQNKGWLQLLMALRVLPDLAHIVRAATRNTQELAEDSPKSLAQNLQDGLPYMEETLKTLDSHNRWL